MSEEPKINQELVAWAYENLNNLPKGIEYEKMISSLPYSCYDKELFYARNRFHELALDYGDIRMKDFNNDPFAHKQARFEYLSKIFGKIDSTAVVEPPFFVDYGCNVSVGKNFYANFNLTLLDCTLIIIGDNVLLGPNVCFTTATHPTDPEERLSGVEWAKPIRVGNNVWIGANVCILPGVTIGDNVTIGAGSVVNKDVASNTVVAGVPARVIKYVGEKASEPPVA